LTSVLAVCLATSLPALAFDPHEWARESDPNNAKTQFCVTNGGSQSWNDNAKLRAADAEAKWESAPGSNVIMDTTPEDCFPDSARIEMKWITCWPFAGQALGYTQWDPTIQSGGGFEGTWWIAFVKYVSCDSGAALYPFNFTATGPASGSTQLDFQSLIEHEMGHAMGLHHPEAAEIVNFRPGAATYPHKSFDGNFYTVMFEELPEGRTIRNLRQDDLSGAAWVNDRSILARPNTAEYCGTYQGNVLEDPGGYLVLTKLRASRRFRLLVHVHDHPDYDRLKAFPRDTDVYSQVARDKWSIDRSKRPSTSPYQVEPGLSRWNDEH
jgi:hypothetical protein